MKPFNTVAIIAPLHEHSQKRANIKKTVNELVARLRKDYRLVVNQATKTQLNEDIEVSDHWQQLCDVVVVVGGDGSMLDVAGRVAGTNIPIVGVNRGRLGFLVDIHPDELDKVQAVLDGHYHADARFLLSMCIEQNGHICYRDVALNDVVLHAGKSVHTIDFELTIDNKKVYRQHADGLIIATPTGSTAYNLSAGGAIVHPSLSAICVTPMYPHTLSSRPLLVADRSHIALKVHKDNRTQPMVSTDGKPSVPLQSDQQLTITKHPTPLTLLHPLGFDFYKACRTKLNWNSFGDGFVLSDDKE